MVRPDGKSSGGDRGQPRNRARDDARSQRTRNCLVASSVPPAAVRSPIPGAGGAETDHERKTGGCNTPPRRPQLRTCVTSRLVTAAEPSPTTDSSRRPPVPLPDEYRRNPTTPSSPSTLATPSPALPSSSTPVSAGQSNAPATGTTRTRLHPRPNRSCSGTADANARPALAFAVLDVDDAFDPGLGGNRAVLHVESVEPNVAQAPVGRPYASVLNALQRAGSGARRTRSVRRRSSRAHPAGTALRRHAPEARRRARVSHDHARPAGVAVAVAGARQEHPQVDAKTALGMVISEAKTTSGDWCIVVFHVGSRPEHAPGVVRLTRRRCRHRAASRARDGAAIRRPAGCGTGMVSPAGE